MGNTTKQMRSFYYSLPLNVKNFIASAYGLKERHERYGKVYHDSLAFLRESQFWSNEKLLNYQHGRTQEFLKNIIVQTAYYRTNKLYLVLLKSNATLSEYPIITKRDLRHDAKSFYHDSYRLMKCRWAHTSGTTGSAIVFPVSNEHFQRECAFRALAYEWNNVSLDGKERTAFCAGHPVAHQDRQHPPFWVYDWSNNWLYFSSYHLTENNLRHYVNELETFQPAMLGGYPSSLYLLALAYEKFGTNKLQLKSITTSSETLFDWQREKIEKAFGAKVFNYYGSAETCANIVECEQGELHLKMEHSAVEILDEQNKPCKAGETGRLVCTGFDNYAFPLIRYDMGDVVTISENQTAKCGRGGLLIDSIIGRAEDYIFTPDGRFVGRLDHLFKDSVNVTEAQLYQKSIDEIICRIVKNERYSVEDEKQILDEARIRLGNKIKINFDYLDSIPRTKNGKFRFIVSELDQSKLLKSLAGK